MYIGRKSKFLEIVFWADKANLCKTKDEKSWLFSTFAKLVITFDPDAVEKCFAPIQQDNWKDFPIKIFLFDFLAAKKAKKGLEIGRNNYFPNISTLKWDISS